MKKIYLFLIALLPLTASADDSGTCGENVTWAWVESTKTLTISGTGAMSDYDNSKWTDDVPLFSENPWDKYQNKIEKVVIGPGVTYIGGGSFYGAGGSKYVNLKSVTIGSSVSEIGYFAFRQCEGLTTITVDSSNSYFDSRNNCNAVIEKSSNKLIVGCKTTVIPSSVKEIGYAAFNNLKGITSVTIPDGVTTIGQVAFYGCTNVTTVTIGNDVTDIGGASFYGCEKITALTFGNNVSKIEKSAFTGCSGLTTISLPKSLTSIGDGAFMWCSGLTSITFSNSSTTIGDFSFRECSNLTSITIPDNFTSIGNYAFIECSNLSSVTLGYYLNNIGDNAFENCSKLSNLYCSAPVPPSINYIYPPINWEKAGEIFLYVPSSSINDYVNCNGKGDDPRGGWCYIPTTHILPLPNSGSGKLTTPTITIDKGILKFDCGTDGAEYHYTITYPESSNTIGNNVQMPPSFTVSVYAVKSGYDKSDTATKQFTIASGLKGDVDGNGVVNVLDHVELSKIIMGP